MKNINIRKIMWETQKEHKNKESKKEIKEVTIAGAHDPDELTVDFE